jgi:endonuclease/exonuclease/phosphatase (EEP) superfamily protein YafD
MAERRAARFRIRFYERSDVVVPCEGERHKVRLAGGLRFLARARCPKCRAAVDPTRLRRLRAYAVNLRAPASGHPVDATLWVLTAVALVGSVLTAVLFWRLADRWWPVTMLLFGPRWVLLAPIPLLMLAAAIRDRALLLPLAVASIMILGPVMGFRTGWRRILPAADSGHPVTVATFNVRSGDQLTVGPLELLRLWGAEVAVFQECGFRFAQEIRGLEGWHAWAGQTQCLLSGLPLLETRVMPRDVIERAGGSGLVVSHRLQGPDGPFWLTNVHLDTPRSGINLVRRGSLIQGKSVIERELFLREIEHRQARAFALEAEGPHIVLGDFNTPPESRIYRSEWRGWTNAFSAVGFGLGGTRLNGWIRARIDHVVADAEWDVLDARLGEDVGSDHLPMIATVRRR